MAKHEAESLRLAQKLSIPTPELVAFDEAEAYCGDPAVLMTKCQGLVNLHPKDFSQWIMNIAQTLSQIHTLNNPPFAWTYFSYHNHDCLVPPGWSKYQQEWEQAIHYVSNRNPSQVSNTLFTAITIP